MPPTTQLRVRHARPRNRCPSVLEYTEPACGGCRGGQIIWHPRHPPALTPATPVTGRPGWRFAQDQPGALKLGQGARLHSPDQSGNPPSRSPATKPTASRSRQRDARSPATRATAGRVGPASVRTDRRSARQGLESLQPSTTGSASPAMRTPSRGWRRHDLRSSPGLNRATPAELSRARKMIPTKSHPVVRSRRPSHRPVMLFDAQDRGVA